MAEEECHGLKRPEGTGLGTQRRGHLLGKQSLEAQGVESGVHQVGVYLPQAWAAQRVDVLIPTAVPHMMETVLHGPVVAYHPEQSPWSALPGPQAGQQIPAVNRREHWTGDRQGH